MKQPTQPPNHSTTQTPNQPGCPMTTQPLSWWPPRTITITTATSTTTHHPDYTTTTPIQHYCAVDLYLCYMSQAPNKGHIQPAISQHISGQFDTTILLCSEVFQATNHIKSTPPQLRKLGLMSSWLHLCIKRYFTSKSSWVLRMTCPGQMTFDLKAHVTHFGWDQVISIVMYEANLMRRA